ncbi:MAG: hypothetical protein B7X93_13530 [Hydrogenophilales bacterium 17-61-9]|nr:MAG: hypothetical protein B7X93_13530 [Hydrogenophilales bacterium 17-61-9]
MNTHFKFTIIIPTRERADVLSGSLKTALMQEYDNLEILVSDNFSSDHTRDVVASFNDPRIRYVNTGKRLSMSHNWEFALSHVDGGWLTGRGGTLRHRRFFMAIHYPDRPWPVVLEPAPWRRIAPSTNLAHQGHGRLGLQRHAAHALYRWFRQQRTSAKGAASQWNFLPLHDSGRLFSHRLRACAQTLLLLP